MIGPSIGVLVAPERQRYLQQLTPRVSYEFYRDWLDLPWSDREASPRAILFDPLQIPPEHRVEIIRRLGGLHGVSVIVVAKRLTVDLAPILLEAGRAGIGHFVLWETEDNQDHMRSMLAHLLSERRLKHSCDA